MCVLKGRGDFWQQPGVRGQALLEQELPPTLELCSSRAAVRCSAGGVCPAGGTGTYVTPLSPGLLTNRVPPHLLPLLASNIVVFFFFFLDNPCAS